MNQMKKLLEQAQQMQSKMADLQARLAEEEVEVTTGGGMVTARVNGKHELLALRIKPDAVDPDDVEMLEDLVLSAVNEAQRQVQEKISEEMSKVTGGLNLPGM